MSSSFLIPIIVWIPPGYRVTVVMPDHDLGRTLKGGTGTIRRTWRTISAGETIDTGSDAIRFEKGKRVGPEAAQIHWGPRDDGTEEGTFLEYAILADDEETQFRQDHLPNLYNVFSAEGRKSFFSCHSWKFGSPQVISQIAAFGRYADAYSVIHIDEERDLGDSIVMINPYKKPIMARLHSSDRTEPPRIRIQPESIKIARLKELLAPDDPAWSGQIQISANNRLVAYIVKHSLRDPRIISSVEHLDPYRADPTHYPFFQWLRLQMGSYLLKRRSLRATAPF